MIVAFAEAEALLHGHSTSPQHHLVAFFKQVAKTLRPRTLRFHRQVTELTVCVRQNKNTADNSCSKQPQRACRFLNLQCIIDNIGSKLMYMYVVAEMHQLVANIHSYTHL